jgi:hypothetical protein
MKKLTIINVICLGICFFVAVKGELDDSKTSVVDPKPQPIYIKAGDPLELTCVQDEGLKVQWLKDGDLIDTSSSGFFTLQEIPFGGQTKSILTKDNASADDAGTYTCQPLDKPEDAYNLLVNIFNLSPTEGIAHKDRQDTTLTCNMGGNSAVEGYELKWWRKGVEIKADEKYVINTMNHTLTVIRATDGDEGEYVCTLDLANDQSFNASVYLYMAPQVHDFQKSKNVIQGDPLHLECKAFGYPVPVITWLKDDLPVDLSDDRIKLSDLTTEKGVKLVNATLRIEDLDFSDRADYSCVASASPKFNETRNATVLVRVKDKLAALWPFLGICAEVTILCIIIFIYEKRRAKKMELEEQQEEADHLTNSHAHRGNDEIRQRK